MTHHYVPERDDPNLIYTVRVLRRTDQEAADALGFSKNTIARHRARLGLKPNVRFPVSRAQEKDRPPPADKPNPVNLAHRWLGDRLTERGGQFWLDGVPAGLVKVMRATNRVLKANGLAECLYSPEWRAE